MRACDPRTKRRIRRAGPAGRYRDGAAFRDCAPHFVTVRAAFLVGLCANPAPAAYAATVHRTQPNTETRTNTMSRGGRRHRAGARTRARARTSSDDSET